MITYIERLISRVRLAEILWLVKRDPTLSGPDNSATKIGRMQQGELVLELRKTQNERTSNNRELVVRSTNSRKCCGLQGPQHDYSEEPYMEGIDAVNSDRSVVAIKNQFMSCMDKQVAGSCQSLDRLDRLEDIKAEIIGVHDYSCYACQVEQA